MVRIRLQRFGRRNRPCYRLVAAEGRNPRDGRALEILGTYDPIQTDAAKVYNLKPERIQHWLTTGAQPSDTARSILKRHGIALPWEERLAREKAKMIAERKAGGGKPKGKGKKKGGAALTEAEVASKKAKRQAKRV